MLTGPRFFRYAARLGAYSGVMAARIYEQQRANERGGASTPSGMPGAAPQRDPNLLSKLSADGWLEHNVEKG